MRNLCAITACALGVLITGAVAELSTEEARAIAEHAAEKALTNVDVETYVIADHTMVEFSMPAPEDESYCVDATLGVLSSVWRNQGPADPEAEYALTIAEAQQVIEDYAHYILGADADDLLWTVERGDGWLVEFSAHSTLGSGFGVTTCSGKVSRIDGWLSYYAQYYGDRTPPSTQITQAQAEAIALADCGVTGAQISGETVLDVWQGHASWLVDVELPDDAASGEPTTASILAYEIDAVSGEVLTSDVYEGAQTPSSGSRGEAASSNEGAKPLPWGAVGIAVAAFIVLVIGVSIWRSRRR
jgi:hypothetical protein